jgi:hypothetical protein
MFQEVKMLLISIFKYYRISLIKKQNFHFSNQQTEFGKSVGNFHSRHWKGKSSSEQDETRVRHIVMKANTNCATTKDAHTATASYPSC